MDEKSHDGLKTKANPEILGDKNAKIDARFKGVKRSILCKTLNTAAPRFKFPSLQPKTQVSSLPSTSKPLFCGRAGDGTSCISSRRQAEGLYR